MTEVIEVSGLSKSYGPIPAVVDVSFSVAEGEIFGLLGPNGAGKTTVVECLQGLRRADRGEIKVLGLDPQAEKPVLRRLIGSQLQESALPERIRVREALDLFASFVPGSPDWRILMDQWGLAGKANSSFASLSGGQRQRLFVALALVNKPRLVFLDEMTTGLDPAARRTAWELIRQIRDQGTTVVLVTHFMEEAQKLCDRLAVIDRGIIKAMDSVQGLINSYARSYKVIFSSTEPDLTWLEKVPHVGKMARQGHRVIIEGDGPVLALVAAALVNHGITPDDLRVEQPSLEDVFLAITGSHMAG